MNKTFLVIALIFLAGVAYFILNDGSPKNTTVNNSTQPVKKAVKQDPVEFQGEKGEAVSLVNGVLSITTTGFEVNQVKYFNTTLPSGKTVYFMVVKDNNGTYRAAANACEVCFAGKKGFRQQGDQIICNNCQNTFSLDTLGVVKGGCNPGPINPNVKTVNGQLNINQSDLEQVANLF